MKRTAHGSYALSVLNLEEKGLVSVGEYSYDSKSQFMCISLLNLKGGSGWNTERDRDVRFCNYFPIVISEISDCDTFVREDLDGLSELLGAEIKDEW